MNEFKIGDIVTLDRYNHIDDTQKGWVVKIQPRLMSLPDSKPNEVEYGIALSENGSVICLTDGTSIMESSSITNDDWIRFIISTRR